MAYETASRATVAASAACWHSRGGSLDHATVVDHGSPQPGAPSLTRSRRQHPARGQTPTVHLDTYAHVLNSIAGERYPDLDALIAVARSELVFRQSSVGRSNHTKVLQTATSQHSVVEAANATP